MTEFPSGLYGLRPAMTAFRVLLTGLLLLVLTACGGGGSDGSSPGHQPIVLHGQVVNGPVVGAKVRVHTPDSGLLGVATTGDQGRYSMEVPVAPPWRVVSSGGRLNGEPYVGVLRSLCENAASCATTPYTTLLLALMDEMGLMHKLCSSSARVLLQIHS